MEKDEIGFFHGFLFYTNVCIRQDMTAGAGMMIMETK
jgi:hypothetical protein